MTEEKLEALSQIKSIVENQKFVLVNIISPDEEGHVFSFTIGLSANYDLPEMVFVEEDPKDAKKIVDNVISGCELGLNFEESVGYIDMDNTQLKTGLIPDSAISTLAPQISEFYKKYFPNIVKFNAQWVGRKNVAYPFDRFLDEKLIEVESQSSSKTIQ